MPNTSRSLHEIVVADATPLHYLILIDEIEILQRLFGSIAVPAAVYGELTVSGAPARVRRWMLEKPDWVSLFPDAENSALSFPHLGLGERQAIALAEKSSRRLLLTDDLQARVAAESVGVQIVPTIRLLSIASALSLLDFDLALARLLETNFRLSPRLIKQVREQSSVKSK